MGGRRIMKRRGKDRRDRVAQCKRKRLWRRLVGWLTVYIVVVVCIVVVVLCVCVLLVVLWYCC